MERELWKGYRRLWQELMPASPHSAPQSDSRCRLPGAPPPPSVGRDFQTVAEQEEGPTWRATGGGGFVSHPCFPSGVPKSRNEMSFGISSGIWVRSALPGHADSLGRGAEERRVGVPASAAGTDRTPFLQGCPSPLGPACRTQRSDPSLQAGNQCGVLCRNQTDRCPEDRHEE